MKKSELAKWLAKNGYARTTAVKDALSHIDRAVFGTAEQKTEAYHNVPLSVGFGRFVPQPVTAAFLLELLEPKLGEKILVLGADSGWMTGLIAYIVMGKANAEPHKGRVVVVEPVEQLSEIATKHLEHYRYISENIVEVVHADVHAGHMNEAPYDRIIGMIGTDEIPNAWKEQLRVGGRIVAQLGESILVLDKEGTSEFSERRYFGFQFAK